MLNEHPWGAESHTFAKQFLPAFVRYFFDDDSVAYLDDLMDQATMQALAMRSQATFFRRLLPSRLLIAGTFVPTQSVLAALLGATLSIIVAWIGSAALPVHFALKPTDGLGIGL